MFRFLLIALIFAAPGYAASLPLITNGKVDPKQWYISDGWSNGDWHSCEWRADAVSIVEQGVMLTLSDRGGKIRPHGCGEIQSRADTGYGTYSARIKTAAGSGLNTSFFTYTGPPRIPREQHGEIDFEFLGKNPRTVQLNYYYEGKPQGGEIIDLGFDASADFHDYSFVWEPTQIRWYVDGKLVHTTKPGAKISPLPQRIYLALWSGGASFNDWLGPFTYDKPVSAVFQKVSYEPLKK